MENVVGKEIMGYQILERIGSGGFGAVYRANQSTIGREVAIKIILPGFANDPDFIRRFRNEAQIVSRLEHLHITPLYDYWRDLDGAYLVMRLMRGGSLKRVLKNGPFTLEDSAQLIDQIASALSLAHRKKVIHRDIKPTNILLDEDKNAYLSDFGIAKDFEAVPDKSEKETKYTGSPDYLSPEQARLEEVTIQSDIYSLGVVLYELLAGEHPFPGFSPVEMIYKHLNDNIPVVKTLDIEISRDVNAVIQKATSKNPTERYKHASALAAAFRGAAGLIESRVGKSLVSLLTPREQDVLKGILEGKSNRDIAEELSVELSTIKWYVNQVYRKLNVRSRVQAIVRARELKLLADGSGVAPPTTRIEVLEPENPYKGLHAFRSADEHQFFGREALVDNLISKMGKGSEYARFMAIIGPSGSGKSSLVKAGLIPALWRGEFPGSDKWFVVEMVPGSRPLDELEVALSRVAVNRGGQIGDQLKRDANGLLRAAGLILPDDGSDLMLVIDQFEEIFTLVKDEKDRKYFLDLLSAAITDPQSRVRILITLRADFYDRPLEYHEFGEIVRSRLETVLPLSAGELERAIRQPAKQVRVEFEKDLVMRIIDDVFYQPGALPLLQYALTELFELQDQRTLSLESYEKMGGAVGALAQRAEALFAELDDKGKENVHKMFLRLVAVGEESEEFRRRVTLSEILEISEDKDVMEEVVDTFSTYRLLTLDHDPLTREPTVEVAHEAILQEWERLDQWLDEAREDIRVQHQIAQAAHEWRGAGKDSGFLLRGSRLRQFEAWITDTKLALTSSEWEFLKESQDEDLRATEEEIKRQKRELALERRSRRITQVLAAVFIVAAVATSWLAIQANRAEEDALIQASIGLAGQAELELIVGESARAVLLSLEALKKYPYTWQAERALFSSVQGHRLIEELSGHEAWVGSIQWSPDSSQILSSSHDGTARVWDANTFEEILILEGHNDWVSRASWSPDGRYIATSSRDGTVGIWQADSGEQVAKLLHEDWVFEANWSPSGDRIATGSHDRTIRIWEAGSWVEILLIDGHDDFVEVARWSPDGTRLASASGDGTVRVWDANTGEELIVFEGHEDAVIDVAWSPNGRRLASGSLDGSAKIWDTVNGEELFNLSGEGRGTMRWVLWSPDGSKLLTVEQGGNQIDGLAAIWDMATGERLFRLPGIGDLTFATWSPDGSQVAVNDDIRLTRIWDAQNGEQQFTLSRPQTLGAVAWSPDGRSILTGYEDGTIRAWVAGGPELIAFPGQLPTGVAWSPDGEKIVHIEAGESLIISESGSGREIMELESGGDAFSGASWSPDGEMIASGQDSGMLRLWDAQTGAELLAIQAAEAQIWDPMWSYDVKSISVTGFDGLVHVFDVATGNSRFTVGNSEDGFKMHATWSPDNSVIAAGNSEGLFQIWDASSGELIKSLDFEHWVMGTWWSPDGFKFIETDFLSGLAHIRDSVSGEIITSFAKHVGPVIFGHWSPDGTRVVTAGEDAVRIWDPVTGFEYGEIDIAAWRAFWSPSGDELLTAGTDGIVRIWRVFAETDSLIHFANECCVIRDLTDDERTLFGIPQD